MNLKIKSQIVGSFFIALLIITPITQSSYRPIEILNKQHTEKEIKFNYPKYDTNDDLIEILVCYLDNDKNFQKSIIKISKSLYNQFIQELSEINNQEIDIIDFIQQKLQIMKNYQLIQTEVQIQNIIDFDKIGNLDKLNINITETNSFASNFAPIFILGMGFGLGFGFRRMPVLPRIAGNLFSIGVIGLGTVVCLDLIDSKIYYQFTFTFPYLIHILSGFIGIMMFAFDNIYPPENGPPFTIYSNFIALGMAGVAIGFIFPPI